MRNSDKGKAPSVHPVLATALSAALAVSMSPAVAFAAAGQGSQDPVLLGDEAEPVDLADCTVADIDPMIYSGYDLEPDVFVTYGDVTLVEGVDYTVSYSDNHDVGTATATITGIGGYTGSVGAPFEILHANIVDLDFDITDLEGMHVPFTGHAGAGITYHGTSNGIELVQGEDFLVEYDKDVIDIGEYGATITGIGNFTGQLRFTFTVDPVSIGEASLESEIPDCTYTGSAIEPGFSLVRNGIELKKGVDYSVAYSDNVSAGTATITVVGMGNYNGESVHHFRITDKASTVKPSVSELAAMCAGQTGSFNVESTGSGKLVVNSSDESVATASIADGKVTVAAVKPGTAYVRVSSAADGSYSGAEPVVVKVVVRNHSDSKWHLVTAPNAAGTGTAERNCILCGKSESRAVSVVSASVSLDQTAFIYTGSAIEPAVTAVARDSMGNEYNLDVSDPAAGFTVTYSDNVNAGCGKVAVTSDWPGVSCTKEFTISKPDIANCTISGFKTSYAYTGSTLSQKGVKIVVNDRALVKGVDYTVSQSGVTAGKQTVTYKGIGNYTGSFDRYTVVKPAKVTKVKAKALGNRKLQVSWSAVKGVAARAAGYTVAVKSGGKTIAAKRISKASVSRVLLSLPAKADGKKVSVSVTAYKKVSGKTYTSDKSAVKKVVVS